MNDLHAAIDIGAANGASPIAIIVPCHRVIASHGDLNGDAWDLHRQRWLFEYQKAMAAKEQAPEPPAMRLSRHGC